MTPHFERILLVETDFSRRGAIRTRLESDGYDVVLADHAEEAMERIADYTDISAVATTFHLDEMTGLKLIRLLLRKAEYEGGLVLYDCPKPTAAEEKLEEWIDGPITYAVLADPTDIEDLVGALNDVISAETETETETVSSEDDL